MTNKTLMGRLLQTSVLAGAAFAAATPAIAQDENGDQIVVTGSRIVRSDVEAPSPVATVSAADLAISNTVNTEEYLNELPQLIPAFDSTSNNPGNGSATVSLRGLGTTRTLVLVDGKRFVGQGVNQVVDINNIPAALLERVDILTGGASAVYGSDAMAGVVNFILKDDFEGFQLDSSYRISEESDGAIFTTSATIGGNFDNGRGNAVLSLSYTDRDDVLQGDRDFSFNTLVDNGPGVDFGTGGSFNTLPGSFRPVAGSFFDFTSIGGDPSQCTSQGGGNFCIGAINDGGNIRPVFLDGDGNDLYNYAPTNYLQLPQERYNVSGFATYDITDNISAYARGIFSSIIVDSQLAPTPAGLTLNVDVNDPNLNAFPDLVTLFEDNGLRVADSDGDGFDEYQFRVNRRFRELGPRNSLRDTNTFQLLAGFTGTIWDDWTWDASASYGRSQVDQIQTGNLSVSATQACILSGTCDFFNFQNLSDAAVAQISRTGAIFTTTETTQVIGTLTGEVDGVQFPGASSPLAVAFGAEYREEYADQLPDSVLGPDVRGFNSSVAIEGRYNVAEVFGEFELPIVEGADFAESINLNGAVRFSDYSSVGNTESYAIGGDWTPVEGLRFRTQFQRAVRAPNLGELFATPSNGFPGIGDPCAGGGNGFYNLLTADQQAALQNCPAGVPVGQLNSQIETLFAGSGSLEAEEADTFTIGAVWEPSYVDGLTVILDYYQIEIDNALGTPSVQGIFDDCHLFGVQSQCDLIVRDAGGVADNVGNIRDSAGNPVPAANQTPVLVANQVGLTVEGIDYQINYNFEPGFVPGDLRLGLTGSHTLENSFQSTPGSTVFDCVGAYSGACGEPIPENKWSASATWANGPTSLTARYNYIGEVSDANGIRYGAYAGTRRVAELDGEGYLDLSGSHDVSENLTITGGIRNVLDDEPPVLGDCCNEQGNTWPATYETLGRQFFVGGSLKF
jgi:outer membrane receptor protein involved in Fe transport